MLYRGDHFHTVWSEWKSGKTEREREEGRPENSRLSSSKKGDINMAEAIKQ